MLRNLQLLKLIGEFGKAINYKVNTQKSIIFLYASNKQKENKTKFKNSSWEWQQGKWQSRELQDASLHPTNYWDSSNFLKELLELWRLAGKHEAFRVEPDEEAGEFW